MSASSFRQHFNFSTLTLLKARPRMLALGLSPAVENPRVLPAPERGYRQLCDGHHRALYV